MTKKNHLKKSTKKIIDYEHVLDNTPEKTDLKDKNKDRFQPAVKPVDDRQKESKLDKPIKSKVKDFKNFAPEPIPIDEYYRLLDERLNKEEKDDKLTFGNQAKNGKSITQQSFIIDFNWEEIQNHLLNNDNQEDKNEIKQKSLKNNFMEQNQPDDNSAFSKFRQFKDSNPKINHQAELNQQSNIKKNLPKRDPKLERARAKKAAQKLAEEKLVLSKEEQLKQAKEKREKMQKIKTRYTNYSRSRSRKRSNSSKRGGPKS